VAWLVGLPDEASLRVDAALSASEQLNHPFTMSWALLYGAIVGALRGDLAAAAARAADLAALCTRHGFSYRLSQAHILLYWAQVRGHQPSLGLLADSIRKVRALGAQVFMPLYFALLADASLAEGDVQRGIGAANDGIAIATETQETFYLAELYRLPRGAAARDRRGRQPPVRDRPPARSGRSRGAGRPLPGSPRRGHPRPARRGVRVR
jgi:predicted ATPase